MDMCGKNQEKILRLQFQKRLNNKKVIREISNLLENFVWFNVIYDVHELQKRVFVFVNKEHMCCYFEA